MKRFGLVVLATATMLAFASPVSAGGGGSTANKQYRALVCPTSNYAVATATCSNSRVSATSGSVGFTFVIRNKSSQQGLGSSQLTAPAGFTSLASTDGSISACTATSTTACYTSVSGT